MKTLLGLIICIFGMSCSIVQGQHSMDNIDFVSFRFQHSLRIPNHYIVIEFDKQKTNKKDLYSVQEQANNAYYTTIKINSMPSSNDPQWNSTKIDTSYVIDNSLFNALVQDIALLDCIDIRSAIMDGLDGNECVLEYGTRSNSITYKFWSPEFRTKERGLVEFYNLCMKTISIAGFSQKNIFDTQ